VKDSCSERMWENLFCPHCDASVADITGGPPIHLPASEPAQVDEDPMKLVALSQKMDAFLSLVLGGTQGRFIPGLDQSVTNLRDVQKQLLDFQRKDAAERKAKPAQPPPAPSQPPPPAAEPPPRPPVDWSALGLKLVEEASKKTGQ